MVTVFPDLVQQVGLLLLPGGQLGGRGEVNDQHGAHHAPRRIQNGATGDELARFLEAAGAGQMFFARVEAALVGAGAGVVVGGYQVLGA